MDDFEYCNIKETIQFFSEVFENDFSLNNLYDLTKKGFLTPLFYHKGVCIDILDKTPPYSFYSVDGYFNHSCIDHLFFKNEIQVSSGKFISGTIHNYVSKKTVLREINEDFGFYFLNTNFDYSLYLNDLDHASLFTNNALTVFTEQIRFEKGDINQCIQSINDNADFKFEKQHILKLKSKIQELERQIEMLEQNLELNSNRKKGTSRNADGKIITLLVCLLSETSRKHKKNFNRENETVNIASIGNEITNMIELLGLPKHLTNGLKSPQKSISKHHNDNKDISDRIIKHLKSNEEIFKRILNGEDMTDQSKTK